MDQTFEQRRALEKAIIERVISDALGSSDATLELSVEDEAPTICPETLLAQILDLDEARLYYHRDGQRQAFGWVFFVLGNSGWDVIADYTTNLESLLVGANSLADQTEAEHDMHHR